MNKEKYLAKRAQLLSEAQAFLEKGELENFNSKTKEVEKLDEDFENYGKAQANLNALQGASVNPVIPGAAVGQVIDRLNDVGATEDVYASTEYRLAFANYIATGRAMPSKFVNADENTTTGDVASVIPTTIIPKLIESLESIGMIYPLVTHTTYKTGINIPTSTVKPVATRVAEGATSDRQKKTTTYISFSKFKLRCEISWTMEVNEMTLPLFEAAFVRQVSEAKVKKIESEIISTADGTTSCRGILAETPNDGQALTASALTYDLLVKAEAALPEAYEAGAVWCMSKKTFMGFVGMTDSAGQPIARVNYGIGGKPERTLLGRTVVTCGDYMNSFSDSLEAGKVFAFIFNFADYVHNTVYDMGIQRKQDWDTEDILTKVVMSDDGKVVDKGSLVTVAKAVSEG